MGASAQNSQPGAPLPLEQLIDRMAMINRVHAALRSTLKIEEIYSIVLSSMIARSALNFSRAILLESVERRHVLRGLTALGAPTRADHERIQDEIEEEETALADMVENLHAINAEAGEQNLFQESLRDLSSHSFWITTFQRFSTNNELLDQVRRVEMSSPLATRHTTSTSDFVQDVLSSPTSRIVSRADLEAAAPSSALLDLLPVDSLWSVVRTQKGIRLLIITDRMFQDEPLTEIDQLHVDWFSGQVSLALENAEMFNDLQDTYRGLRELDRMKSNFLATISHELRTPLTAINGYVQILLTGKVGDLNKEQKDLLGRVANQGDQLTNKVNDLIEIAELDAETEVEPRFDAVDPLEIVKQAVRQFEASPNTKWVRVISDLPESLPPIYTSPEALERIIHHLIDNAVKFSHPGGKIEVECETRIESLAISVTDHGIGMGSTQIEHIFDAFYQVDSHLTRAYPGLGVGLAIIKKQLDLTGGQIEVSSQPEQGSRFTISYPLANPNAE